MILSLRHDGDSNLVCHSMAWGGTSKLTLNNGILDARKYILINRKMICLEVCRI